MTRRLVRIVLVVGALIAVLIPVGFYFFYARSLAEREAAVAKRFLEHAGTFRVVMEQALADDDFAQVFLFKSLSSGARDAGTAFNSRLSWPGARLQNEGTPKLATVPAELEGKLKNLRSQLRANRDQALAELRSLPNEQLQTIDTSIFKEALEFEYWDLWRSCPVELKGLMPFEEPMPELVVLQTLAKIHFAKALKTGEEGQAFKEIVHFAHLLATQETLVSNMIALSVLNIARDLAGKPYDDAMAERIRHLVFASAVRLRWAAGVRLDLAELEPGLTGGRALAGFCAGLAEASAFSFFAPESYRANYADAVGRFKNQVLASPCRLTLLRLHQSSKSVYSPWPPSPSEMAPTNPLEALLWWLPATELLMWRSNMLLALPELEPLKLSAK